MSAEKSVKSAYELALERLEQQGIEKPRDEAFSADVLQQMEEVRSKAAARIAELEILHRKKRGSLADPSEQSEEDEHFRAEVRRIEERRDRDIERLRQG